MILGAGLVWLALRLWRDAGRRTAARAGYFDLVLPQMRAARRALAPTGFARVSGQVAGTLTDLQAVPDTLTYRKLPALWLLVTQPGALPVGQRIHMMARPRGIEPFSAFDQLPHQTVLPADFPHDAYWVQGTVTLDDGFEKTFPLEGRDGPQRIELGEHRVRSLRLHSLVKCDMPSAFPALRQIEVYGHDL